MLPLDLAFNCPALKIVLYNHHHRPYREGSPLITFFYPLYLHYYYLKRQLHHHHINHHLLPLPPSLK
jgi:hypothetical protein